MVIGIIHASFTHARSDLIFTIILEVASGQNVALIDHYMHVRPSITLPRPSVNTPHPGA